MRITLRERSDRREEENPRYSKVKKLQRLEISFPPPREQIVVMRGGMWNRVVQTNIETPKLKKQKKKKKKKEKKNNKRSERISRFRLFKLVLVKKKERKKNRRLIKDFSFSYRTFSPRSGIKRKKRINRRIRCYTCWYQSIHIYI